MIKYHRQRVPSSQAALIPPVEDAYVLSLLLLSLSLLLILNGSINITGVRPFGRFDHLTEYSAHEHVQSPKHFCTWKVCDFIELIVLSAMKII